MLDELEKLEMSPKSFGKMIEGASALSLLSYIGLKKGGTWSFGARALVLTAGLIGMAYGHSVLKEEKYKTMCDEADVEIAKKEPIQLEEISESEATDLRKGVLEELNQSAETVELPKAEPIEVDEEANIEDFLPDNSRELNRQLEDLFQ